MKSRLPRIFLLLFALLGPAAAQPAQAPPLSARHVLLLYAYGYGGRGVELFNEGFFKAITDAGFSVGNVHAEYLDLQRNKDVPGYRADLLGMLRKKYARRPIDLIITAQQPALEFLLAEGREIAPQAPVITLQHRPLTEAEKAGRRIVGEANQFDIKGTLERALELFPQTQRVLFASGSSAADLKVVEEAAGVAESWRGKLEFEYTTGMTLDEILTRVARLPPHSIILFTQYNVDAKGRVALAYEAEHMIVKAANAPVFGFYDYNLKNGGIGGSVIGVEESGGRTARLALDILRGAGPAAAGTLRVNENIPMFDWQQIQRWGGDASRLPANAVFVNRPPSAWEQHRDIIIGTVIFILAEAVLIAMLLASNSGRRRARTELRRALAEAQAVSNDNLKLYEQATAARQAAEAATAELRAQTETLAVTQAEALEAQHQARLAALNLMEDAIAAHKQAEDSNAELRENQEVFNHFMENSPIYVFFKDENIRSLRLSRNYEQMLGKPMAELVGKNMDELFPSALARSMVADDMRILREGREITVDEELNGRFYTTIKFPILIDGQPRYLAGYTIDITERKTSEDQLRKLSLAVEQSPESVVITDLEARIEYVNDAMLRVSGYRREELIGQNPRILHSGKTPRETFVAMWAALTQGQPWKGELHNRRKDGSEYIEFEIITPIRQPDGRITHYVAVKEDITEKKHIAVELDQHRHHLEEMVTRRTAELEGARRQAEAANEAKSAFLANMSHEIRTPMNAIVGLAHLLQRHIVEPEQRARLDKIVDATHHLLALINDILDLSKIEAGKLTLEVAEFDLMRVLENVAALVAERAQARGLELVIDIEPALAEAPFLLGDATRLAQTLLNYAGNAVKFTTRGSITLRARIVEANASDLLLRFEVEDTGVGIAPTDRARLFQSFEQVDASITRKYGGTGLGLAINRQLAELMGGEVGVDSEPGVGSVFWLTARLGRSDRPGRPWATALLRDRRALIVGGGPSAHAILQQMLQTLGLRVDAVPTAEAALTTIALADSDGAPIDVALFDWHTPDLPERNVAREIRALPLCRPAPRLLVVVPGLLGGREAAEHAGFANLLTKPVSLSSLNDLLTQLLRDAPDGVSMPRTPPSEETLLRTTQAHGGARILVAEDNPINQEVARDLLREVGLTVDLADNGAQALEMASATAYDAILMDMQMPVMDGIEATQRIRVLPGRENTPILAMTANAFGEDRQRCLDAGMNDYVSKPFDPETLFATLLRWLPTLSGVALERAANEAPENADLRRHLAGIPGLDVEAGLKTLLGRVARYVELLRRFAQTHGEDGDRLRALLAARDKKAARLQAHTLSGVAATLGAGDVAAAAAGLEEALRRQQPPAACDTALAAVETALTRLTDALRTALPEEARSVPEFDGPEFDGPGIDALLTQLEMLLARDDATINRVFAAAMPGLRQALGADIAALERRIEAYDYPAALTLVRALQARGR